MTLGLKEKLLKTYFVVHLGGEIPYANAQSDFKEDFFWVWKKKFFRVKSDFFGFSMFQVRFVTLIFSGMSKIWRITRIFR